MDKKSIYLYYFDLDEPISNETLSETLPTEEYNDSISLIRKKSIYYKRLFLSKHTKIHPKNLKFIKNEYGKPFLCPSHQNPLEFNISHSGSLGVIAISPVPIGIDIEKISLKRSTERLSKIAEKIFSKALYTHWNKEKKTEEFYTLWCKHEATQKYHGKSIFGQKLCLKNQTEAQKSQVIPYKNENYQECILYKKDKKSHITFKRSHVNIKETV